MYRSKEHIKSTTSKPPTQNSTTISKISSTTPQGELPSSCSQIAATGREAVSSSCQEPNPAAASEPQTPAPRGAPKALPVCATSKAERKL